LTKERPLGQLGIAIALHASFNGCDDDAAIELGHRASETFGHRKISEELLREILVWTRTEEVP
jgi:hypothetical protein